MVTITRNKCLRIETESDTPAVGVGIRDDTTVSYSNDSVLVVLDIIEVLDTRKYYLLDRDSAPL
jgi:hypothetical protein